MSEACPFGVCDGSGFRVDEDTSTAYPCRCRGQRVSRARARSLSSSIPKRYRGVSFDRPPASNIDDAILRPVRSFVRKINENLDQGRGFFFVGDEGSGKTTLAMLVTTAALDAGRTAAVYSLPRLLAEIRATYNEGSEHSYLELLDHLASVDLLHVDDLGAERRNDWVIEQLYAVMNSRWESERSVVITTSTGREDLVDQISLRTVTRIEAMCEQIPLSRSGADRPAGTTEYYAEMEDRVKGLSAGLRTA